MALRKKHEVLEEPQDYEIERRRHRDIIRIPEAGLSANQVEQHREDGWRNVSVAPPAQTTKEIIRENVWGRASDSWGLLFSSRFIR